eukprot:gene9092-22110_t
MGDDNPPLARQLRGGGFLGFSRGLVTKGEEALNKLKKGKQRSEGCTIRFSQSWKYGMQLSITIDNVSGNITAPRVVHKVEYREIHRAQLSPFFPANIHIVVDRSGIDSSTLEDIHDDHGRATLTLPLPHDNRPLVLAKLRLLARRANIPHNIPRKVLKAGKGVDLKHVNITQGEFRRFLNE